MNTVLIDSQAGITDNFRALHLSLSQGELRLLFNMMTSLPSPWIQGPVPVRSASQGRVHAEFLSVTTWLRHECASPALNRLATYDIATSNELICIHRFRLKYTKPWV